jgi:hypothetical protein
MRRLLFFLLLALSIAAIGATQAPPVTQVEPGTLGGQYGETEVAPLDEIVRHPGRYEKRMVRTQGFFERGFGLAHYILHEGHDDVLLLSVVSGSEVMGPGGVTEGVLSTQAPSGSGGEFDMLLGRRVEVRGVIRMIRPKQYLMGVDADKIDDPDLPVMPPPGDNVPPITLSFLSISDATPLGHGAGDTDGGVLRGLLRDPEAQRHATKVVGQFRGANLFGDVPDLPGHDSGDFVLKEGDTAVWVIGKAAAGKGFRLDPQSQGDTRFWLEVEGRLEPCGGQVCFKAHRVRMAKRPVTPED